MEDRLSIGRYGVVGHPGQRLLYADAELQSCKVRPQAAVNTGAESEMAVGLTVEDASVRIGKLTVVAIGGCVVDNDRLPWAKVLPTEFRESIRRNGSVPRLQSA
jgi:hypothetical protein